MAEGGAGRARRPEEIGEAALLLVENDDLAGRVVLCPHDGPWGLIPLDERPRIEPLPGLPGR